LERARGARFDRTEAANDVEVLKTVVMCAVREDMGAIQILPRRWQENKCLHSADGRGESDGEREFLQREPGGNV